jgi:hypothetical protein
MRKIPMEVSLATQGADGRAFGGTVNVDFHSAFLARGVLILGVLIGQKRYPAML